MGRVGDDDLLTRLVVTVLVIGADDHQAGQLTMGTGARVEGEIGHTRDSRQGVAQLPLSFHGALSRSIGLQRMERGERREGSYLLINRRVIFHRAGA